MRDNHRFIEFKIETAENMNEDKIILLAHPKNKELLARLLYKLQVELDNFGKGKEDA